MEKEDIENPPWDVKEVKISLGGTDDRRGWIYANVYNNESLSVTFNGTKMRKAINGSNTFEEIPMDVARMLRDFLNYAVPE